MTARRHLFVATGRAAFGEALVGLELARALHDAGDQVGFLYPSPLARLFRDAPFARATVDVAESDLVAALGAAVRDRGFETLTLVDVTAVVSSVGPRVARALAAELPARLLGLDLWSLPVTDLVWDVGDVDVALDPFVRAVPALRPSPLAGPELPGAYAALPDVPPLAADERAGVRAAVGVGPDDRLLVTTTASWQLPALHRGPGPRRLAAALPAALALLDRRLDARTRWRHVGPEPLATLGDAPRYRWLGALAPADFRRLLAASDALVTLNRAATAIPAAIAAGIPVVVATSALALEHVDEAAAFPDDVRAWLASVAPLRPFRVCPIGLHRFLAPAIAASGLGAAVREVEIAEPDAAAATIVALTADTDARAEAAAARAACAARVATLPSALARFRELVA